MSHADSIEVAHGKTRCVVLMPPEGETDQGLVSLIEARGWEPVRLDDAHLAMAELCLIERTRDATDDCGQPHPGEPEISGAPATPGVLVLAAPVTPERAMELKALIQAVGKYLPDTSIWLHVDDDLSPLSVGRTRTTAAEQSAQDKSISRQSVSSRTPVELESEPEALPEGSLTHRFGPESLQLAGADESPAPQNDDTAEAEGALAFEDDPHPHRITPEELELLFQGDGGREPGEPGVPGVPLI